MIDVNRVVDEILEGERINDKYLGQQVSRQFSKFLKYSQSHKPETTHGESYSKVEEAFEGFLDDTCVEESGYENLSGKVTSLDQYGVSPRFSHSRGSPVNPVSPISP